jgi:hypothetical protein
VSAAKQSKVRYTVDDLGRALRTGARFLPDVPAHQQGSGVIDVNGAWRELNRRIDVPSIHTVAPIVHPMAAYAARGSIGEGIFELEGWTAGASGTREIRFTRESGPHGALTYSVSWTGNDGTFTAPRTITLPLRVSVPVPVTVSAGRPGAHSAILNLHDEVTGAIVCRRMVAVVAAEDADPATQTLRLAGALPLMQKSAHFIRVPEGSGSGSAVLELEVMQGAVSVAVAPNYGLVPFEYHHLLPQIGRTFLPGRYTAVVPRPRAGTWMIDVGNASARMERDRALVRTGTAEYAITVRFISASLRVTPVDGDIGIAVENRGAALRDPVVQTSFATLTSHVAGFRSSGLPNLFAIDVPAGSSTVTFDARSDSPDGALLEMHLYDCTTGECFSHDFTLPAARTQQLLVRRPTAGRWIAAVNAAPFPIAAGGFALDVVVAGPTARHVRLPRVSRPPGAAWSQLVHMLSASSVPDSSNVLLCELVDEEVDRAQVDQRWETRPAMPDFRTLPAPVGAAIHPLRRWRN